MARVPLVYPKMPNASAAKLEKCIAFEKYDGTNLHWVWERELGWYAFGTRRDRYDLDAVGIGDFADSHSGLEQAPGLFREKLETQLTPILAERNFYGSGELTVFTEFLGANSFAGQHAESDEKQLVLLDVLTHDGFLSPFEFAEQFESVPCARVVHRGKFNGQFAANVREGKFDVREGVVCKGGETGEVWMVKIKTNEYMLRLKDSFANDWHDYWE